MSGTDQQIMAAKKPLVIEGSVENFMSEVVEASKTVPIIVDFWAPWCGPCKTLGPALEAAVTKAGGRVRLVKFDIDKNQVVAEKLQVQSIPAVFAFWQGQPVDGFQGAVPPSQIEAFVAKAAALTGDPAEDGLAEALVAAETMLADGAAVDAAQIFAAILEEDPANAVAYGGIIRSYLAAGEIEQAEALLNNVPEKFSSAPEIDTARAQVELAKQAADAGPLEELSAAVEADPDNHQARLDLSVALHGSGDAQGAVDMLLELFKRDREWQDEAAKTQLFKVFESLQAKDPIVLNGRRKLSSMIFA